MTGSLRCYGFVFLIVTLLVSLGAMICPAQTRDYFTDEEIELIRNTQQIDKRVEVLAKAIDRRFAVLKISVGVPALEGKEWGTLPTGTRVELLADIRNILQKAIDDIDNLSARPTSMVIDPIEKEKDKKKQKGFAELFPKAVRNLAAAAHRYDPALKQALDVTKDQHERGLIADSIDLCGEIIASVQKL